mmetsp:Transcript_21815/g.42918  ORF Transcript_21815/g.42918 Transcript_21815/m.42918 type:complete len:970 (+) Transcript_21815:328-3237(+)
MSVFSRACYGRFTWISLLASILVAMYTTQTATADDGVGQIDTYMYDFPGAVDDMRWVGQDKSTILVLSNNLRLHRSTDNGRTFSDLANDLAQAAHKAEGRPQLSDVQIRRIIQHTSNPQVIVLVSNGVVQYYSDNGGASFSAFRSPAPIAELTLHPSLDSHILMTAHTPKCKLYPSASKLSSSNPLDSGKDANGKDVCYKALYMSEDSGATFSLLRKYVVQADWFERLLASEQGLGRSQSTGESPTSAREAGWHLFSRKHEYIPRDRKSVLCTAFPSQTTGDQRFGAWNANVHLVVSEDNFKSEQRLVHGGNKFLFTKHFIFVAQVPSEGRSDVNLQLSADRCDTFYAARMPFKITQKAFTVLDSNTGVVFLHANHLGNNANYGHVYVSDSTGGNYSFSLRDNVRNVGGKCDFERILSIEGVYIANYVHNVDELENYETARQQALEQGDSSRVARNKIRRPSSQVRSVISFDRGGEWSLLRAPVQDAAGKPITCDTLDCGLHLHGHAAQFSPIYSSPAAVGIIMGVGNVGTHLSERSGEESTYLSSDGGLTWKEIRKGSHIYEIGAHGGLILMARDDVPTKTLLYSWNHGVDWMEIEFTKNPIDVDNIIVEPSAVNRIFHVFGTLNGNTDETLDHGVLITLDFSGLHERECSGAYMPQSPDSDYELWSPRDGDSEGLGAGSSCHLGREVNYLRRKSHAQCFTPLEFEAKRFVRNCECTERDFECDFGFRREVSHGPCVRDPGVSNETLGLPGICPKGGFYSISNGYRLVGGNTCVGGKDLGPTRFPCSRGLLGVSAGGWLVLLIVGVLVAVMLHLNNKEKGPLDAFGTQDFGNDMKTWWEHVKDTIRFRRSPRFLFSYSRVGSPAPRGMNFADADLGDDHDVHSFVDDEDNIHEAHESDLLPPIAMTTGGAGASSNSAAPSFAEAGPLRFRHAQSNATSIPVLKAPPTASPLDVLDNTAVGSKGEGDLV